MKILWFWTRAVGAAVLLVVGSLMIFDACSCTPTQAAKVESVTVVQGKAVLDYDAKLLACQAVGREAGVYSAYEACTKEAGL